MSLMVCVRSTLFIWLVTGLAALCAPGSCFAAFGNIDSSFGPGGAVIGFGGLKYPGMATCCYSSQPVDIVEQADGRIVVIGSMQKTGTMDLFGRIERYTSSGARDTTFGSSGVVLLGDTQGYFPRAVTIDGEGRIVVAGITNQDKPFAARLNSDGSADSTFGESGVTFLPGSTFAAAVAIDDAGRVIVLTDRMNRLLADGTPDVEYGTGGTSETPNLFQPIDLEILADGSALALSEGRLTKFDPAGTLDTSFAENGIADVQIETFSGSVDGGLEVGNDGSIYVAGIREIGFWNERTVPFMVAKFTAGGQPQEEFGDAGVVTVKPSPDGSNAWVNDLLLLSDGDVLLLGSRNGEADPRRMVQVRLDSDGEVDTGFSADGTQSFAFFHSETWGAELARDGGILLAGASSAGSEDVNPRGTWGFAVVRLCGEHPCTGIDPEHPQSGSAGGDTIFGSFVDDDLAAGLGDDNVLGFGEDDHLDGGGGNDYLAAGSGSDRVRGGTGRDRVFGGLGSDHLRGGPGRDQLDGQAGNDELVGGPHSDTIYAGTGRDIVDAGRGNDVVRVRDGSPDVVRCGLGFDEVEADRRDRLVGCELARLG
jgi:uncharacterized delta-60 repeat protein